MSSEFIEHLQPYGILIRSSGNNPSIQQFSKEQVLEWIREHRILVFRGFDTLSKQQLALYAQRLGEPLQWAFGAINVLKVKPDTENYLYTDRYVPMHWDGAFAGKGKIPHIILFQCILAPRKEDMGGTTFADTVRIVENAAAGRIGEWEKISVTYTTEKIVHYGGKITQSLLEHHPVTGSTVIRYAEPVSDLNPVSLEVKGLKDKTQDEFIREMRDLLYDDKNYFVHRWEDGDIVLADNHALLHGREAFRNPNERILQRINILRRPEGFSIQRYLKNSLTIRRKEFFVAELPIFLIPVLLSATEYTVFLHPTLYLGLAAIIMLFNLGDMINCYSDYELDAIYKSHLSNAVYELGKAHVKGQMILSGAMAFLLTIAISYINHQYYLIPLTLAGTVAGLGYSIPPFHFKSRGIAQLLCLWGIIFWGPMLFTAIITNGFPSLINLGLFAAYGFHQMGIIMLNTAEDYTEDRQVGLRTIIVALGLHNSMRFAWWLILFSGALIQALLFVLFIQAGAPYFLLGSILIFTTGWLKIIFEFGKILQNIRGKNEEEATEELKRNGMKVPQWLQIGAYTSLFAVAVLFVWRLYSGG